MHFGVVGEHLGQGSELKSTDVAAHLSLEVDPLMSVQVDLLREGMAADGALEGLLTSVDLCEDEKGRMKIQWRLKRRMKTGR